MKMNEIAGAIKQYPAFIPMVESRADIKNNFSAPIGVLLGASVVFQEFCLPRCQVG
jgi:hypothetical protein